MLLSVSSIVLPKNELLLSATFAGLCLAPLLMRASILANRKPTFFPPKNTYHPQQSLSVFFTTILPSITESISSGLYPNPLFLADTTSNGKAVPNLAGRVSVSCHCRLCSPRTSAGSFNLNRVGFCTTDYTFSIFLLCGVRMPGSTCKFMFDSTNVAMPSGIKLLYAKKVSLSLPSVTVISLLDGHDALIQCCSRMIQYCQGMLRRLFGGSDLEKMFEECKADKSHDMMIPKKILDYAAKYLTPPREQKNNVSININISNNLHNQINISINNHPQARNAQDPTQKRKELTNLVLKKIRSSSDVQRIKGLVLAHAIIKKTFDPQFMEVIAEEVDHYILCQEQEGKGRDEFIKQNIIAFYCQYLKKFILNVDTYRYAERYVSCGRPEGGGGYIEMVNEGFVILNLCNYILQSQYTFNKMGRYYLEHSEMVNLFLMYLSDLAIYNAYIKELSKLSLKTIKQATPEEIRHHFLFVTQSQKTSDRLYEFFYNRYYYAQVKKLILMPTFLTIHADEYNQLASYVKKNDPDLAQLVKNSKYSGGRSSSRPKTSVTDLDDLATRLNKTELLEKQHDFLSFMTFVKEEHQQLEDLRDVTVKRFTMHKPQ